MKKNITFFIASMHGGGAERVTLYMINYLVNKDWDVTLLLCDKKGENLKFIDPKINIIELQSKSALFSIFDLIKYLRNTKPANFYSVMNYINVVTMLGVKLSGYKGNVVLAEHTSVLLNNLKNKILRYSAKKLYHSADKIVCISQGVKKTVISIVGNLDNIVVLPNPLQLKNIKKKIKNDSIFRFISVGRLENEKNFQLLINSFSKLTHTRSDQKFELCIFGEGSERLMLEKLIEKLGIREIVFLPGFTEDIFLKLSQADCFVLSSNNEGLPTVIIEALNVGLPIISTDCPSGPAEILDNGKFGRLVPINNIAALTQAMFEESLGHTVSNITERISRSTDFSLENVMNQYESLFKN